MNICPDIQNLIAQVDQLTEERIARNAEIQALRRSKFPSPATIACAEAIIEAQVGYYADQGEPPGLRKGWRYPGNLAVTLAQCVLAEAEANRC